MKSARATVSPADAETLTVLTVLGSPKLLARESFAGALTALALIPEVISFSFISGVDPKAALMASVVLCFIMSVLGGRPAMVTAAAGSVALVIGPLVKAHGAAYILPTVFLAGGLQCFFGFAGMAKLARFIPRSVMIGFVNALGILIFSAQIAHVLPGSLIVYFLFLLTLILLLVVPRLTSAVPASLIAVLVVTAIAVFGHLSVPSVGTGGHFASGLIDITALIVPLNIQTLLIIWPTTLSVAFVGLLETLLTAKLVDELTESESHKGRECWALGIANITAGFYGGIAGCAMIGQTIVNVKLGSARTRVSTVMAAVILFALLTWLSKLMSLIPMVVLAAIMMTVALKAVNWHSVQSSTLRRLPLSETLVMLLTVIVTVVTGNLALGVVSGVLLEAIALLHGMTRFIRVERTLSEDQQTVRYQVYGPLFFGSSNDLVLKFSYSVDPRDVVIDLSASRIWDASCVAALDSIEAKYRARGTVISLIGLDEHSSALYTRLAGNL